MKIFWSKTTRLALVALFLFTGLAQGQNIMKLDTASGTTNDTVEIALSVMNQDTFIAFQCDVLLPEGFQYVPNSIALSKRAQDHVISATTVDSNGVRLVAYSPNNKAFTADSGIVATFRVTTPAAAEGTYPVWLKNGILGNPKSKNILDSVVNGQIVLSPLGIRQNSRLSESICCYPNPFHQTVTFRWPTESHPVQLQVFDLQGRLLATSPLTGNRQAFNAQKLLGKDARSGDYFFRFRFIENNHQVTVVKKVQYQR